MAKPMPSMTPTGWFHVARSYEVAVGEVHQRYSDPPPLSASEFRGFTAICESAKQFHPGGRRGGAAQLNSMTAEAR